MTLFFAIGITDLFILFLSGCAKVPDCDLARLQGPIELDTSQEIALQREFFEEGGWPSEKWWEMFGDEQLNSIMEQALQESPTIHKALAKVAEAEQEARKEKAALFPHLNFNYEEQWQYFSKNGFERSFFQTPPGSPPIRATDNQIDLGLNFDYEIDFFGRNRNLFKAALGQARAERAEAKQATLILTTLIAQTYIELQAKRAQLDVLKDRLNQRTQQFELTTVRNKFGLDSALPVLEKEQRIYAVEEALILLEKEIILDRHMLSMLVGIGPEQDVAPKKMMLIFDQPIALPTDLSSDLLARRPDLTAQIWRVEAAAKEIGAAKADFYPRVNLLAFAELESLSFNKLLTWQSKQGGLVPAIHLPIFTGGRLTANLKGKVAAFNEATYRYNELVLNAAREVADKIVTITSTFDALTQQINSLEAVEEQFQWQHSRYKNGISNFITVLEKSDKLLTQRYQLLGYERDYLLSVLMLVKALGGGYRTCGPLPKGCI